MVTYEPDTRHAAQTPPPTCPKCGSHRTEVVGRSEDGRSITLRCNACGERSTVVMDRRSSDAENITDEVDAIRAVGRALAQLPDVESRRRVLQWAAERFQIDTAAPVSAPAAAVTAPLMAECLNAIDPTLSMDGVHDLFRAAAEPDDSLSLGTDDIRDAGMSEVPLAAAARATCEPVAEARRCGERTPLESMVHSFVADFQQLANEWQTVFATPVSESQ